MWVAAEDKGSQLYPSPGPRVAPLDVEVMLTGSRAAHAQKAREAEQRQSEDVSDAEEEAEETVDGAACNETACLLQEE